MLDDFILSDDGDELLGPFYEMFDCLIGVEEPDGEDLFLEVGGKAYMIPADESVEDFCRAVLDSLVQKRNLFIERYERYEAYPESQIGEVDY